MILLVYIIYVKINYNVYIIVILLLICRVLSTSRSADITPLGAAPRTLAPPIARETVASPAVGAHSTVFGWHRRTTARRVVRHRSSAGQIDVSADTARLPVPAARPLPSAAPAIILPFAARVGQSPVSAAATTTGAGPPLLTGATQSVCLPRWPTPPTRLLPPQP